jgi:hypothetical protein
MSGKYIQAQAPVNRSRKHYPKQFKHVLRRLPEKADLRLAYSTQNKGDRNFRNTSSLLFRPVDCFQQKELAIFDSLDAFPQV